MRLVNKDASVLVSALSAGAPVGDFWSVLQSVCMCHQSRGLMSVTMSRSSAGSLLPSRAPSQQTGWDMRSQQ